MNIDVTEERSQIQEKKTATEKEVEYRALMNAFYDKSIGTNIDKLNNFAKYVPRQPLTRFLSKYELFKKILNVHGSIIEGGVHLGGGLMTFAQLSSILEPVNFQREIIGFDTFAGFEDMSDQDGKSKSQFAKKGGFAAKSFDDLTACIEIYDRNRSLNHIKKVSIVKGDVDDTLPKYLEENPHTIVSLLYLDFDVYQPTKTAIELLLPRMPKGAIIAFDELNCDRWPGETLALRDTIGINGLRLERSTFDTMISYAVIE